METFDLLFHDEYGGLTNLGSSKLPLIVCLETVEGTTKGSEERLSLMVPVNNL